jgi:hypothetical protein
MQKYIEFLHMPLMTGKMEKRVGGTYAVTDSLPKTAGSRFSRRAESGELFLAEAGACKGGQHTKTGNKEV